MARHQFTLAALATTALPGIEPARSHAFTGGGDGDFDSALITTAEGEHLVVRAPASSDAMVRFEAETRAAGLLTPGVRARLPFLVPTLRGTAPKARGGVPPIAVFDYLPGRRLRPGAVDAGGPLAVSLGTSIATLHALPPATVRGLTTTTAVETRKAVADLVADADRSRRVPHQLLERWEGAIDDDAIWPYQPVLIHGSLTPDRILVGDDESGGQKVTAILGWGDLALGDPARDFAWALALPVPGATATVFAVAGAKRRDRSDSSMQQRATLYAELDIARWLLFGVESGRADVIDDATGMLASLLASVEAGAAGSVVHRPSHTLSVDEVEQMLADQRSVLTAPVR